MSKQSRYYQRLFWSVSRPLKYLGLTLDEWAVAGAGVVPGIILCNTGKYKLGLIFFTGGFALCYVFKKYKRLSQGLKLKSFFIAHNLLLAPKTYPKLLKKERVGR